MSLQFNHFEVKILQHISIYPLYTCIVMCLGQRLLYYEILKTTTFSVLTPIEREYKKKKRVNVRVTLAYNVLGL